MASQVALEITRQCGENSILRAGGETEEKQKIKREEGGGGLSLLIMRMLMRVIGKEG